MQFKEADDLKESRPDTNVLDGRSNTIVEESEVADGNILDSKPSYDEIDMEVYRNYGDGNTGLRQPRLKFEF